MPKFSQPVQIPAKERTHLTDLLEHVEPAIRERIQIVLACADGYSNKEVAEMLDIDVHTVSRWRKAYIANGIAGLESAKGAGRKSKTNADELEAQIMRLLEQPDKEWTVHALAQALNATDYQVSKIVKSKNIELTTRQHVWTFSTQDMCRSADVETVGLYIAPTQCAILTCWHPYGIETAPGVFATHQRIMAEKLTNAGYELSLLDMIAEATYYKEASSSPSMQETIDDWMTTVQAGNANQLNEIQYHLFVWNQNPFQYKAMLPACVQQTMCGSAKDMLKKYHSWAGALTTCAHLYDVEMLSNTIEMYLERATDSMDAFCWSKTVLSVGTQDAPIHLEIPKEEETTMLSLDQWLQILTSDMPPLTDSEMAAGFIAYVKDKDGFSYRNITLDDAFPGVDQFGFDSEEAFMKGLNQLESKIISLRNKAGIASTELYLERVKKLNPVGIVRMFLIESELGRFAFPLSIHSLPGVMTNKRLKTSGYRRINSLPSATHSE